MATAIKRISDLEKAANKKQPGRDPDLSALIKTLNLVEQGKFEAADLEHGRSLVALAQVLKEITGVETT